MANKKITELTELTATNIANNDVLAIVDVGGDETKKVAISSLYDIFDNNVTIDTAKIVYGLTGANTNISALSVNTLPLIGGTITGPVVSYSINSSSNVSIAQSLAIGYVDHRVPQANLDVKDNVYIGGATTIAGVLTLGTQLAVGQGGTGVTSLGDGGVLFGSGTSAVTFSPVLTDGVMVVGDGSGDPVLEGNTALRTSIGVGTGDTPQFYGANVSGNVSINRSLAVGYTDGRVPQANLEVKGNTYISGATTIVGAATLSSTVDITGKLTSSSVTPAFYGANVTGNVSVTRSLAIGYTDGRVPQANLEVKGNAFISGLSYPTSDGDDGQVITTDGSGTLSFEAAGGGYFKGSQTTGNATKGPGDIFRINRANLNANVTILAHHNASCTGPLTILNQQILTINGTVVII
jgi:serine acetyltransferase